MYALHLLDIDLLNFIKLNQNTSITYLGFQNLLVFILVLLLILFVKWKQFYLFLQFLKSNITFVYFINELLFIRCFCKLYLGDSCIYVVFELMDENIFLLIIVLYILLIYFIRRLYLSSRLTKRQICKYFTLNYKLTKSTLLSSYHRNIGIKIMQLSSVQTNTKKKTDYNFYVVPNKHRLCNIKVYSIYVCCLLCQTLGQFVLESSVKQAWILFLLLLHLYLSNMIYKKV